MSDDGISIDASHMDGTVVLTVSGEIDLVSAPLLEAALDEYGGGRNGGRRWRAGR